MCSGANLSNSAFTSRWTFQITAQPTAPHTSPPRSDGSDVVRIIQNELNPSFIRTGMLHPDLHTDHSICRVLPSAQIQTEAEAAGQAHPPFAPTSRSSSSSRASPGHAANSPFSVQRETMPINCFAIHTKLLQYSLHRVVTRII